MIHVQKIDAKGKPGLSTPKKSVTIKGTTNFFTCTDPSEGSKISCSVTSPVERIKFSNFGMINVLKSAIADAVVFGWAGIPVSSFRKGTTCKVDDTYPAEKGGPHIVCGSEKEFEKPWKYAN